jgi:hypothetical protein
MSSAFVATYFDALDNLSWFCQAQGTGAGQEVLRRAVRMAYREIVAARDWQCMVRNGRISIHAAQTTGTIAYNNTTRQATLTGATFPLWCINGSLRIGDVVSDIESQQNDTVVTLDATLNPGEDVAAGTSYTLYQRYYLLPSNFVAMAGTMAEQSWLIGQYITPAQMFSLDRYEDTTGSIQWYTIAQAQDLYGSMALYVHPASDADETLDVAYKSRPRDIRYTGMDTADKAGTISATSGTATITGVGTSFSSAHIGSILRIGTTSADPTGIEGKTPYVEQRTITAVASATSCTLDANVSASYSGVKYNISDPIDLDVSLYDAFLRACENQIALSRDFKNRVAVYAAYQASLFQAKCADGRSIGRSIVGGGGGTQRARFRDYGLDLVGDTVE